MDRQTVYPGQILPETTLLQMAKDSMIGLAKLSAAVLGTSTVANGFATTATSPASLQVKVAPGELYSMASIDATTWSSLAADTTHSILKQGIALDSTTLSCAAPTTSGQSINYLVEAIYQDLDATPVLLPYYNSTNPSQPYSGQGNNGLTQNTVRKGSVIIQVKAGASATTGSQVTPAPDAGYVGLYVVTVAYGQTTITSTSISQYVSAPLLSSGILQMIAGLAPLASPAFTGTPTAPTAAVGTSSTQLANTAFVQAALAAYQSNNYTVANGTSNAYVATLSPVPASLFAGMTLTLAMSGANTGPATLNVNGTGVKPILGGNYQPLQGGEFSSTARYASLVYSPSRDSWVIISTAAGPVQVAPGTASGHAATIAQVQSGYATFGTDSGTANTYVVAFTPAFATRTEGQILSFKANTSNTGACTINDGVAVAPLVGGAHSALQGGEIVAGGDCLVQWNSTVGSGSYVLIECGGGAEQVGAATKSNHAMRLGQAVGRLIAIQVITATGTYTPTTGATTARITVIGGGAAGGTAGATTSGTVAGAGGGGAGGVGQSTVSVSSISGTTATIGSAGAPSSSTAGGAGGATTFGGITASGGTGGALVGPLAPPQGGLGGSGGTTTGGNVFNMRGGNGMHGQSSSTAYVLSGSGGSNPYGGGGPGNLLSVAAAAAGSIGQGFGAGGGGGASNSGAVLASGANGTTGAVIIEEFS